MKVKGITLLILSIVLLSSCRESTSSRQETNKSRKIKTISIYLLDGSKLGISEMIVYDPSGQLVLKTFQFPQSDEPLEKDYTQYLYNGKHLVKEVSSSRLLSELDLENIDSLTEDLYSIITFNEFMDTISIVDPCQTSHF